MSRIRASAVCEKSLCALAKEISLGDYLYLGHGEECQNGRSRPSILADAFEALLAAIYLDSSVETVRTFLLPFISEKIKETIEGHTSTDYKTMLQQLIQREDGEILDYVLVGESGPAHQRVFEIEARLGSNVIGKGSGRSKRRAEQSAAKEALLLFGAIEK
jgi:ribonuclease-3